MIFSILNEQLCIQEGALGVCGMVIDAEYRSGD